MFSDVSLCVAAMQDPAMHVFPMRATAKCAPHASEPALRPPMPGSLIINVDEAGSALHAPGPRLQPPFLLLPILPSQLLPVESPFPSHHPLAAGTGTSRPFPQQGGN